MNKTAVTTVQIEQLCLACGMCCDGTLFHHAPISDNNDYVLAESLGFTVDAGGGKRAFTLPCGFFKAACTIYEQQRPQVCGSFFCLPIHRLKKGEIELDKVKGLLEKAKGLKDRFASVSQSHSELTGKTFNEVCCFLELHGYPKNEQVAMRSRYFELYLIQAKLFPLLQRMTGKHKR